jgi:aminoglycoside 6'-N-acetyltransferase
MASSDPAVGAAPAIILRPLAPGDEAELLRIHLTEEVARWWGPPEEAFPWDEPESTRLTIVVDGAIAGLIQFSEQHEPRYRHAGIDLFLDPALHGRGFGSEAVRRVVRILIEERKHHRITIDPALANTAAIRAYAKAGFKPVGVMRSYERDPPLRGAGAPLRGAGPPLRGAGDEDAGSHDNLLMELLAGEQRD